MPKSKKTIPQRRAYYRQNPCRFFTSVLDVKKELLWSKMIEVANSVRDNKRTVVGAGHSVSKALDVDTLIYTRNDFVSMGKIRPGDEVLTEIGDFVEVSGVSSVKLKQCYEVVFDDGARVIADADHLWNVHDYLTRKSIRRKRGDYREQWDKTTSVTTEWISRNLKHHKQNNLSIPVCKPIKGSLRIDFPYTLGFWLGDGTRGLGSVSVCPKDASTIMANISSEGFIPKKQPSNEFGYGIGGKRRMLDSLRRKLRNIGVLTDKHFPHWLIQLNWTDKLKVLQGYMDADGWRLRHKGCAMVGTTDKRMHDTFVPFLASFGVKVFTGVEIMQYKGNDKPVYKCCFAPVFQPFKLQRKFLVNGKKHRVRKQARMILACKEVGKRKVKCISIVNNRGLFLSGLHMVPTHNTYNAARIALWFLYCHVPSTVVTTAPIHKQVEELLWREIRLAHANARGPLGGQPSATKLDLQSLTGQKWYAIGFSTKPDTVTQQATAFQGYHNEHILVIFDEAAGIMPQIWRAAEHVLTSGHYRWLAIGNPTAPKGNFVEALNSGGGEDGWNVINISVLDTPNYIENKEVIPGVSGREYVERMKTKYGEDSNEYKIRVKGEVPEYGVGTFFGRELAEAEKKGHIGHYPHDPRTRVYTVWDVGHSYTAIWFVQFIRQQIRLIDFYYDNEGKGLAMYAKALQDKPYKYAQHFAPHDVEGSNAKSVQTGRYLVDVAEELGISFTVLTPYRFNDRIEAARDLAKVCLIHKPACGEGLDALTMYRRQLDASRSTDDKPVYFDAPVKDWTCHPADAFSYLAMAYRYDLIIDDQRVGYPGVIPNELQLAGADTYGTDYDPLSAVRS